MFEKAYRYIVYTLMNDTLVGFLITQSYVLVYVVLINFCKLIIPATKGTVLSYVVITSMVL